MLYRTGMFGGLFVNVPNGWPLCVPHVVRDKGDGATWRSPQRTVANLPATMAEGRDNVWVFARASCRAARALVLVDGRRSEGTQAMGEGYA
ncbi:hypothetical protein [Streptomyces sp. NPDC018711]|uniref:hypothetical protein n=1 Tax=Streptomyces sp. NPDC018711 TaxID=3365052 RepID=UPI00379E6647